MGKDLDIAFDIRYCFGDKIMLRILVVDIGCYFG